MSAGVRYAIMSPNLKVTLLRAGLLGIATSAVPALMPLVARDLIAGGPLVSGVLLGSFGIGAVVGALANGPLGRRLSHEWLVRRPSLGLAVGTGPIGSAAGWASGWLYVSNSGVA